MTKMFGSWDARALEFSQINDVKTKRLMHVLINEPMHLYLHY